MNPEDDPNYRFGYFDGFIPPPTTVEAVLKVSGYEEIHVVIPMSQFLNLLTEHRMRTATPSPEELLEQERKRRAQAWAAEERKRRQKEAEEKARQEEEARLKEEEERIRDHYRSPFYTTGFPFEDGPMPWARFTENASHASSAFFNFGQAYAHASNQNGQPPVKKRGKARVIELAGLKSDLGYTDRQIWRKAQKNCHPDTGGSHELWIELESLKYYMNL